MKLYNPSTNVAYNSRTCKTRSGFISVVERIEYNENGIPAHAMLSSRETHSTRGKARHYADSMARYQFRAHCALSGISVTR